MRKLILLALFVAFGIFPVYVSAQTPEKTRWIPKDKQTEKVLSKKAQEEKLAKEAEKRKTEALLQEQERMARAKKSAGASSSVERKAAPASSNETAAGLGGTTEPEYKAAPYSHVGSQKIESKTKPSKTRIRNRTAEDKKNTERRDKRSGVASRDAKEEIKRPGDRASVPMSHKTGPSVVAPTPAGSQKPGDQPGAPRTGYDNKGRSVRDKKATEESKRNKRHGNARDAKEEIKRPGALADDQPMLVVPPTDEEKSGAAAKDTSKINRRFTHFSIELPSNWKIDQRPASADSNNIVFSSPGEKTVLMVSVAPAEFPGRAAAEAKQNAYIYKDHVAGISKVDYVAGGAYRLETVSGETTIYYGNIGSGKVISIQLIGRETAEVKAILSSIK